MMRSLIFAILFLASWSVQAQDLVYAKRIIDSLCAPGMHGRGYVNKGDLKAARFIQQEFRKIGLKPAKGQSFFQKFALDVNTFPGELEISINGQELKAGADYILSPTSGGTDKTLYLGLLDLEEDDISSKKKFKKFRKKARKKAVVIDPEKFDDYKDNEYFRAISANKINAKAIVKLEDKLTWGVGRKAVGYPEILILRDSFPAAAKSIHIKIEQDMLRQYETQNVIGIIKGKKHPDSFIVFSAHYDHLGRMGNNAYFPGANDNASGTAMIMDFARHFSKKGNQPDYSMAFMAFAAEEAGIVGSRFYNFKPQFPLEQISVVVNLDLMGNGQDGMMVVNGKVFKEDYNKLVSINEGNQYLKQIKKRGPAANSDHYFFYENDVKSFFFYLLGDYPYYHDIYDQPHRLSLDGYDGTFKLIVDYANWIQQRHN